MRKTIIVCVLLVLLCSLSIVSVDAASTWSRTFGGSRSDQVNSLVATSDGGYALAGCAYYSNPSSSDFWLVKTDALGNVEWDRTYGTQGTVFEVANSLVATSDGGYALAGYTNTYAAWLVKTDALGNIQWNRTYGGGENSDFARSLVEASDGGYAIAGYTSLSGDVPFLYDSWLIKTDENGMFSTSTPTPTPSPMATASPSPTPSIPEFPPTAILPLLAGFFILSIIFSKMKRAREIRY